MITKTIGITLLIFKGLDVIQNFIDGSSRLYGSYNDCPDTFIRDCH